MKKVLVGTVIIAVFSATWLFANPEINKKHAGKQKDGQSVNCVFCHVKGKIAKIKGQDHKKLEQDKLCMGAGCHK